jgi:hypothetical protein
LPAPFRRGKPADRIREMTRNPVARRPRRGRALLLLFLVSLAPRLMAQVPQSAGPLSFEPLAVFATRRLRESSGVAVSRAHRFEVRGARAGDWEDIAIGPCPAAARACLYIGDTGDNAEHRPAAALYVVPEPDPAAAPEARRTEPAHRIVITYREGALDVEGLAVTPDGTVFLVSKGRSGPIELFRIPRDSLASDSIALAPGPRSRSPLSATWGGS